MLHTTPAESVHFDQRKMQVQQLVGDWVELEKNDALLHVGKVHECGHWRR